MSKTPTDFKLRRTVAAVRGSRGRRRRPGTIVWVGRVLMTLIVALVVTAATIVGMIAYYSRDLPSVRSLRDYRPPQVTRVVDRHGELLGELYTERRTVVALDRIPRALVLSVLAAEDADFYRHEGFDYAGLFRAVVRGVLSGGHFRGTSTITQQVVKNMMLGAERTFDRKIRELILARQLEQEFTKDEILALYLNHINFGHGRYGVQEASRFYFGHDVDTLDLAEASLLAGIPQSPTHLSPRSHPEASRRRQRFVLDQLEDKHDEYWPDLPLATIQSAREARVDLAPLPEARQSAPEIVEIARTALTELAGQESARRGGYIVQTTLDRGLQSQTREALRAGLRALDQRRGTKAPFRRARVRRGEQSEALAAIPELRVGGTYDAVVVGHDDASGSIELDVGGHRATVDLHESTRYNPDGLPPSRFIDEGARTRVSIVSLRDPRTEGSTARARLELGPQGCVIILDPRTREVLALVGGYDAETGFDRARHAQRQPGSTFKPFVYAAAIRSRRYTAASIMIDAPGVYDQWMPQNFETWSFRGEIRLREALANSVNQVAVRLLEDVTPPEAIALATRAGIHTPLEPSLALALGASAVRPIELANAYAVFASGGTWSPLRYITRVLAPNGSELQLPPSEPAQEVMSTAEAFLMTSLMTSVVQHGTATAATRLGRPVAGKTGTSNDARDAWFAGYTPDLVGLVWVGFDDNRSLGRRESGARAALPIWIEAMKAAGEGRPVLEFPVPSGIVVARVDPGSGLLAHEGQADAIEEVFLEGTVPTGVAREPGVLDSNAFLMEQLGSVGTESGRVTTPPGAP